MLNETCEICGWAIFRLREDGKNSEEDFCLNKRCKGGRKYWKKQAMELKIKFR